MQLLSRRQFLGAVVAASLLPSMAMAASEILIYCGITMVKPVMEMAVNFEKNTGVKVNISQGGSEDLYQSLKSTKKGDIYFPGEPSYRTKYVSEGLLGDMKTIGFNQSAIFVRKGNPKKVTSDLTQFLRTDITTALCSAEQGSIGKETKDIFTKAGIYDQVIGNAAQLLPDSRTLNAALKKGQVDAVINWRATGFFADNQPVIDIIDLPETIAEPQALLMNLLTFSAAAKEAQQFIDYAASDEGQGIMRKHGFLDAKKAK